MGKGLLGDVCRWPVTLLLYVQLSVSGSTKVRGGIKNTLLRSNIALFRSIYILDQFGGKKSS